ncbi:uncharacterized protein LOC111286112 isoform X2 [Durio zibethinus]|uniref:Uncharacterized protein LOC111286112 isoform X2 n=1 Tax=Durio zibethinus TaxID=66656 RepID=A0A6P5XTX0_DURZI|nr:uncharacterized protein LOC111286112 isoform X2 [Durio zibethinus]
MKSIQAINRILPGINGPNSTKPEFLPSYPYVLCFNARLPVTNSLKLFLNESQCQQQFAPLLKHKIYASVSKCRLGTAVCRLGGEDKSASGDNEGSQWKAIEKAMGNFGKQESIEDMLKQQIEKEYNDEGSGKAPPRGGGGNGGGRGDGFRGSEDDGLFGILDETLQVILATIGFICLVKIYTHPY